MATIKSFTDLPQSKVLAEFLPLESADMGYIPSADDDDGNTLYTAEFKSEFIFDEDCCIPCWSLAALLEEMPEIINFDGDKSVYALEILKEGGLYYLSYGNLLGRSRIEIEPQECFVDACYEMIIKLHEQKLL